MISNFELHLFFPFLIILFLVLIFVIARAFKDKLDNKKDIHFKDKDVEVVSEAFQKIGEVKHGSKNEIILNLQNLENNKEIQTNNENIKKILEKIELLEKTNNEQKANNAVLETRISNLSKVIGREV